ncbi:MAG: DUF2092 domain-containing protein [Endomicrobiales bacterium]|jgi:hypothetical protein
MMKAINRMFIPAIQWLRPALIVSVITGLMTLSALASTAKNHVQPKSAIDPQAAEFMRRMSDYLAQSPFFSVNAEVWQDIQLIHGQRVQSGRTVELQIRRPNHLHVEIHSTRHSRAVYYDGSKITLLNRTRNLYGSIAAPSSLDKAVDEANEHFGITIPMEDLIVSDPYQNAMSKVTSGIDLGPVTVLGVACEHLAFSQGTNDWQIWIEQGAMPVPRKIVITYKDEEGMPQYTEILSNWDFQTKLPDFLFNFEPPALSSKISVSQIKNENETHKSEVK